MAPRSALLSVLLVCAAACEGSSPSNAPDGSAGGADVAAVDDLPPDDTGVTEAPLRYTPEGCSYMVTTAATARSLARGDRTTFGPGPGATPRNVHVNWASDPSTTAAVVWSTDEATRASVMQYGNSMTALDRTAVGHVSTAGLMALGLVTAHEVHVCGLRPDTTYYYRVGGEGHWSEVQRFRTAPAPGRSDYDVNFLVAGDSRDSAMVFRQVQERALMVSGMRQPDFQVFSGDAVFVGALQTAWESWFAAGSPVFRAMPLVMVHGNHEGLATNYLLQFAQPQAGDPDRDELYFSFDYGPIHFAVLNDTPRAGDYPNGFGGAQLRWLREDLARARSNRPRVPFIVVLSHKSPFTSSNHVDDADTVYLRRTLPAVLDEYGVELMINGHDHEFEISRELDGQGQPVAAGRRGVRYLISAASGAELYSVGDRPWKQYAESTVNFTLVHATSSVIEVTPYRGDGTVIEQGRLRIAPRN